MRIGLCPPELISFNPVPLAKSNEVIQSRTGQKPVQLCAAGVFLEKQKKREHPKTNRIKANGFMRLAHGFVREFSFIRFPSRFLWRAYYGCVHFVTLQPQFRSEKMLTPPAKPNASRKRAIAMSKLSLRAGASGKNRRRRSWRRYRCRGFYQARRNSRPPYLPLPA
jgi:hypothetical protein